MNKLGILMIMALLLVGVVSASNGVLQDEYVTMGYNDTYVNTYCLFDNNAPVANFEVQIDVVWQELDNVLGYSLGDVANPAGFSVTLLNTHTDVNGCVDLLLETTEENGLFGYTVGGWNGLTLVGPEDGYAFVPEFGVIAALGILGAAGFFISRKRK